MSGGRQKPGDSFPLRIRLPLLLLGLVALAALAPAIFLGRIPAETHLLEEFGPWAPLPYQTHRMSGGGDSFFAFLPDRLFAIQEWKAGRIPLWNPYQTAGLPILGLQSANPLDPSILLHWFLPTGPALGVNYALLLFLAGAGMILLLSEMGIRSAPALAVGSIAFALNPYFLYWMELRVFLAGLAGLPMALWALERLAGGRSSIRAGAVLALCLGYGAVAGTLQTVALFLSLLVLRTAWLLVARRAPPLKVSTADPSRARGLLWIGAAIIVGLAIAALPLIATTELLLESTRVTDAAGYYATSNFLPWRVVALWFCPDVFGWPADNVDMPLLHFGRTIAASSGWGAIGIVPLFLVIIAFARRVGPPGERLFWGGLMVLPIAGLLVMGTPPGEWLRTSWPRLDHIDLLRCLVLVNLGGAVLASWGMSRLMELWRERERAGWLQPLGLLLVLSMFAAAGLPRLTDLLRGGGDSNWILPLALALVVVVLGAWGVKRFIELWRRRENAGWTMPLALLLVFGVVAVGFGRQGMDPPHGLLRDLLPLLVALGLMAAAGFLAFRRPGNAHRLAWLVPLLIALELGRSHFQFNRFAPAGSDYPYRPMVGELQRLLGPPDYFRFVTPGALRAFPPNTASLFHLSDIRGYSNLPLARFRTLVDCSENRVLANQTVITAVGSPINRLLGVAYVLLYADGKMPPELFEPLPLAGAEPKGFYRRHDPLPRTFLVHEGMVVPDEATFCDVFGQPNYDPGRTVILPTLEGSLPRLVRTEQPEEAVITRYESDAVTIRVRAATDALLVLGDAWYPGWRATVDGVDTRIYPAYWGLRGVAVGAGPHEVVFRYRPVWLGPGIALSLLAFGITLIGLVRPGRRATRP